MFTTQSQWSEYGSSYSNFYIHTSKFIIKNNVFTPLHVWPRMLTSLSSIDLSEWSMLTLV